MIDRKAFRFFLANAGGIVGHNAETAIALARAEAYARDHDWTVVWEDDDPCDGCCCCDGTHGTEHQSCEWAALYLPGEKYPAASLGRITDATREYRRVIEAELASEALYEVRQHERAFWERYDRAIERMAQP